jgi:hypothetical protein
MHHDRPDHKTSNDKPVHHLHDVTRRARILNLAADALELAGTWDSDLTGPDVARLLGHPLATPYHYEAARAINETCSGRRFNAPPTCNIPLAVQILRDDATPARQLGDGGAR